jgi:tetratricopeptide (TPR) repeat protein
VIAGAALVLAAVLHVGVARAEGESAAAEALFQQGKTLKEAKRWSEACPKFAAAYQLDRTLGALMNLADCEEQLGQIASAWAHWGEAVELAEKTGDKRASFASTRRDTLSKRLPLIQVDVKPQAATATVKLTVYRDDLRIDPAAYGVPLPSDPGAHVIRVRRGTEVLHVEKVTAVEAKTTPVAIDLAAIERAAPPPPAPEGPAVVAPLGNQKAIGFAVLGVGGVTLVAAGVLEILALVKKGQADTADACANHFCTQPGFDAVTSARTFANAGQWVGIGGVVVAAVGATLVATAPRVVKAAPRSSARVSGWIGQGGGGIGVTGAFP